MRHLQLLLSLNRTNASRRLVASCGTSVATATSQRFSAFALPPLRNYSSGHDTKRETFFDQVKRQMKQDLESDEKFKQLKEEMGKDSTVAAAKKVADAAQKTTEKVGVVLDAVQQKLAERGQRILDNKFVSKTLEGASFVSEKVGEQKLVRFVLDEYFLDELEKQQFHYHFRSTHGRKKDAEKGVYYNPYTQRMEQMENVKIDTESMGMAVYQPGLGRGANKFSGVKNFLANVSSKVDSSSAIGKLTKGLTDVASKTVDKAAETVFKTNETQECLAVFHEHNPTFTLESFISDAEYIMIPKILQAYFADDVETLRYYVTDECWRGHLYPRIQARITSQVKFDTAILDIRDVDMMAARFIGDVPVLVISSQIQYIYCIRDKNGQGEIVEGKRDDIRQESIFFVFRQDPTGETKDFEIVEMSFGGSARIT